MTNDKRGIESKARPELTRFRGYSACKSAEVIADKLGMPAEKIIKLDANENNYGPSPRVARALQAFSGYHIYPDAAQSELRALLSNYTGMPCDQIVAGAGSDQLIDLIIKLFAAPNEEIINMVPSFAMYRFYADLNSAKTIEVPRGIDFQVDVHAVKNAITPKTKLIFLANPNNPTGTLTSKNDLLALLQTGVPLVVDEAYYEFTGESAVPLMNDWPNLMVLRTFSKWSGLAGLRVGYGLFPRPIADYLHSIRDPYNVNAAALVAVRESFQDIDYLMGNVGKIVAERERFAAAIGKIKWLRSYPSRSNFILCDVLEGNAAELQQRLESQGILVRYYSEPRLRNCLRFSVGKPEEDDILIEALKQVGR
jgi:histidinol-phosphate aminotransferase